MLAQVLVAMAAMATAAAAPATAAHTAGQDVAEAGQTGQSTPRPPTIADPIRGLDLWRGAKVGMSAGEVQRLFPAADAPATPTVLTGGEVDRLQLSGLIARGQPTTAHFYFAGPELVAVELSVQGFKPSERAHNLALARALAASYSATYGEGYDCGDKSLGDVAAYECKWLKGRLSIQLWYMDVAGQAPLFYIAYRQADDPSYDL